jgi:hypothetical protein
MADDIPRCAITTKVPLLANVPMFAKVNEPDSLIVRNEIPNVLPVREDQ